jgi:hypothetical protein
VQRVRYMGVSGNSTNKSEISQEGIREFGG